MLALPVLPPGEVATMPAAIDGILVADGAFNITAYSETDARLAETPVTVEFGKSRVVNFSCDSPLVSNLYRRFAEYDHFDRVGELGFGTNVGISEWIPMNSHINERRPGLHIGLGGHGQRLEAAGYACRVHLDLMTSDATTVVDGHATFDSRKLADVKGEHPALQIGLHDEDIDALTESVVVSSGEATWRPSRAVRCQTRWMRRPSARTVSPGVRRSNEPVTRSARVDNLAGLTPLRLLVGATALSTTGTMVSVVAVPLTAVVALQASAWQVGLLAAAETIPILLVGVPAGAYVDRHRRRRIMVLCDLIRACLLLSIPIAWWLGTLKMYQLYAVVFLIGSATVLFDVAYQSYVPSLIDPDELAPAYRELETANAVARLTGPGLGGALVQFSGPVALVADVFSYLLSALDVLPFSGIDLVIMRMEKLSPEDMKRHLALLRRSLTSVRGSACPEGSPAGQQPFTHADSQVEAPRPAAGGAGGAGENLSGC